MAKRLWDKGDALDPEVLTYTVGDDYLLDRELVEEDVWGSLAHSQMLTECGFLAVTDQQEIARGLREILARHRSGKFTIAPAEEDVHTAVEGQLVELVGEAGRRLHTARSRNDQVLVDLRLFVRRRLLDVAEAALALARELLDLAGREEQTLLPGYTHMRQAMPSTVGLWAAGHAEGVEEDIEALLEAFRFADRCPLGSAAGFGVPLRLNRRRTAELLGFERLQVNAQAVQSSRGKIEAQALLAVSLVGQDLARLAWDLQLYSDPALGFIRLAPSVATGSSIMPQKRNPDVLELTRANSAVLVAHLERILLVAGKLPSSYHRDYQLTKEPLIKGLRLAREMTRVMELTVKGVEVDRERARGAVAPEAYATHRALALVEQGTPFRDAYQRVGQELSEGELPIPTELDQLYASEGSAGDLQLDAARGRLDALASRVRAAKDTLEARLAALEQPA